MKPTPELKQRLTLLAALAAPVIVVQVMRGVLGAGAMPASSVAAPIAVEPAAATPAPEVSAADAKARAKLTAWLAGRPTDAAQLAALRSPMDHIPAPTVVTPAGPAPAVVHSPDGPKQPMVLGTILNTSRGAIAAINGQVLSIGDEVEPGWKLVGINVEARTATVQGPKGQTLLLSR